MPTSALVAYAFSFSTYFASAAEMKRFVNSLSHTGNAIKSEQNTKVKYNVSPAPKVENIEYSVCVVFEWKLLPAPLCF